MSMIILHLPPQQQQLKRQQRRRRQEQQKGQRVFSLSLTQHPDKNISLYLRRYYKMVVSPLPLLPLSLLTWDKIWRSLMQMKQAWSYRPRHNTSLPTLLELPQKGLEKNNNDDNNNYNNHNNFIHAEELIEATQRMCRSKPTLEATPSRGVQLNNWCIM